MRRNGPGDLGHVLPVACIAILRYLPDRKRRKTRDAVLLTEALSGDDEELRELVEEEAVHSHVATLLHEARLRAGLTQAQLAERIGSRQSVVSRLENADYRGHSIAMLVRVADALGPRLVVGFAPGARRRSA